MFLDGHFFYFLPAAYFKIGAILALVLMLTLMAISVVRKERKYIPLIPLCLLVFVASFLYSQEVVKDRPAKPWQIKEVYAAVTEEEGETLRWRIENADEPFDLFDLELFIFGVKEDRRKAEFSPNVNSHLLEALPPKE